MGESPSLSRLEVGPELVHYGRELDGSRVAQVGDSFSGRPEVDAWLESDPNGFLLSALFTQGIPAERAWAGAFELMGRLGHLDVGRLAKAEAADIQRVLEAPPALHRFKATLSRFIVGTARCLVERYGGDASRVWSDCPPADVLIERLSTFPGFGAKKAAMTTEILIRRFGVAVRRHDKTAVPYDVHVRRVMLRSGLVSVDRPSELQEAARAISPERPSLIDLPLWQIGRTWCRPRAPRCGECRLGEVCPRLTQRGARGVG